jgi:hypothetical protein
MFDIDLTSLEPSPERKVHMRLCPSCRSILPVYHSSCPCGSVVPLIPYLDRRPLLLDRDVRNSILDLIDEGANRLTDEVLTDEQDHLVNEYLPFLSKVLKESELAERAKAMGNHTAYRRTSDTKAEILSNFRDMVLPPTLEER